MSHEGRANGEASAEPGLHPPGPLWVLGSRAAKMVNTSARGENTNKLLRFCVQGRGPHPDL